MYYPDRAQFKKLAESYNLIPVYREIVADIDTPVSAFKKLGEKDFSFLLESVEGGERLGRYSFLGSDPYLIFTLNQGKAEIKGEPLEAKKVSDPLGKIKKILEGSHPAELEELPPFFGGAVGFLGYDAIRYFENIPKAGRDDLGLPEAIFIFTDTILIFDHLKHKIKVVANVKTGDNLDELYDQALSKIENLIFKLNQPLAVSPLAEDTEEAGLDDFSVQSNLSKEDFLKRVEQAKEYIRSGDALQIVLSQRFSVDVKSSSFDIYRALRTLNPSPYMYYLRFKDLELIGSSPEPLVKVQGEKVITRPIAGTRPRGKDAAEDEKLEKELLADLKERAEHIMLVDLGRNDLGRVCLSGTVKADPLMFIEKYSHVMHIVSNVEGKLAKDKDAFDVLKSAFPAGTVSGAPKIRAMEIIDELEPTLRGPYAGVVGYFSYSGNLDSCITIRTIVVHKNKAYIQAGAGIVFDSVPEKEYQETVNKAKVLFRAIKMAEPRLRPPGADFGGQGS